MAVKQAKRPATGRLRKSPEVRNRVAGLGLALLTSCLLAASTVATTPGATAPPGPAKRPLYGVNLAGAAFAPEKLPGKMGTDYIYPEKGIADLFVAQGFDTVRLPILWERIQPEPFKPLSKQEMAWVDGSVKDLDGFKTILLDVHNYARYRGKRLDQTAEGSAMLADLWTRLAEHYKGSPKIAFGIMNEPFDIDARAWRTMADRSVQAIRKTGATNLLLIPGTRWTGAHSWMEGDENSNAAAFADFKDPGNNFMFEFHQYLDPDSSGTQDKCQDAEAGGRRLEAATQWLRTHKARGLLGEFGATSSPVCLEALGNMMAYLNANTDVWAGWTYWAAGAWWGGYPMSIQPGDDGRQKPQMAVLQRYMQR
jgi:endoglucanase